MTFALFLMSELRTQEGHSKLIRGAEKQIVIGLSVLSLACLILGVAEPLHKSVAASVVALAGIAVNAAFVGYLFARPIRTADKITGSAAQDPHRNG